MNWILLSSVFIMLLGLAGVVYALKNRAKLSVALRDCENYSNIIDQSNDAMLVIDIVDGKIHQVNPSAAKLLSYTSEQLLGKKLFDLHPAEFLEKSANAVADTWEKGGLIYDHIPFLTSRGDLVPVECSSKVAPFAGRPAIVIYARDISERLRLEAEIKEQRKEIDEKSKDIRDSIEYSRRIQRSFLEDEDKIRTHLSEAFIFFQPRDVVSGDFYWLVNYILSQEVTSETGMVYKKGARVLVVAAVDCTGHGVPGAFMSMIGNSLLEQTIRNWDVRSPAAALDYVNAGLKKQLNKNNYGTPLRDGMDVALCSIDFDGKQMEYAAANNPAYLIRDNTLTVLQAESQPITASPDTIAKPFTNQQIKLMSGDCIYLFTDGYADQFGGEKGKKYMYKRFKELLLAIHQKPMLEQQRLLRSNFEGWRGSNDQIDDVLVIGVRIP